MTNPEGPVLLPCPFCGEAPRVILEGAHGEQETHIFCVCPMEPLALVDGANNLEGAAKIWNTRSGGGSVPLLGNGGGDAWAMRLGIEYLERFNTTQEGNYAAATLRALLARASEEGRT